MQIGQRLLIQMNMDRRFSVSSIIIGFLFNRNEGLYIYDDIQEIKRMKFDSFSIFNCLLSLFFIKQRNYQESNYWVLTAHCIVEVVHSEICHLTQNHCPVQIFFSHYSEVWVSLVLKRLKSIILLGDRDRGRSCVI